MNKWLSWRTIGRCFVAVCVAGCNVFPRTQTIVEIRADRMVEADASEMRFEVTDGQGTLLLERVILLTTSNASRFPFLIPISAKNGDDMRSFRLRVFAQQTRRLADGTVVTAPLAQNQVRAGFRRGEVLSFTLWLLSGCRCNNDSETCEPSGTSTVCVPITRDVRELDAGAARDSAVFDGPDGSMPVDSATENRADAALATDTATNSDAMLPSDAAPRRDSGVADASLSCPSGSHACGSTCRSDDSPTYCGVSCRSCPGLPNGSPTCSGGTCNIQCVAATPDRCPSACVDLNQDPANCGACGRRCAADQTCQARQCVDPPPCSVVNDTCPGLSFCSATRSRCVPGCVRDAQCGSDRTCDTASHACVCRASFTTCGTACVTCPQGALIRATGCSGNACVVMSCAPGYRLDNNACIDVDECLTNDGGCAANERCTNNVGGRTCTCVANCTGPFRSRSQLPPIGFGSTIAVSYDGSVVAVGSASAWARSAFVYTRVGTDWRLDAMPGSDSVQYSIELSRDGTVMAVRDGESRIMVYTRALGGTWDTGTLLPFPEGTHWSTISLAANGRALIADRLVFTNNNGTWTRSSPITSSDVYFVSMAADASTLAMVDFYALRTFANRTGQWLPDDLIPRPTGIDGYGEMSMASDANSIAMFAYRSTGSTVQDAVWNVFVHERSANGWNAATTLPNPENLRPGGIGQLSMSANGSVVTMAYYTVNSSKRAAYYQRTNNVWTVTSLDVFGDPAGALAVSGDGRTLAISDSNRGVVVYTM